jgi:hypothetical protein
VKRLEKTAAKQKKPRRFRKGREAQAAVGRLTTTAGCAGRQVEVMDRRPRSPADFSPCCAGWPGSPKNMEEMDDFKKRQPSAPAPDERQTTEGRGRV